MDMTDPIGAGVGAILGLIKANSDVHNEIQDHASNAIKERYHPWTGLNPKDVPHANTLGDILAGIKSGVGMMEGMRGSQDTHDMNDEILNRIKQEHSPPLTYNLGGSPTAASATGGMGDFGSALLMGAPGAGSGQMLPLLALA